MSMKVAQPGNRAFCDRTKSSGHCINVAVLHLAPLAISRLIGLAGNHGAVCCASMVVGALGRDRLQNDIKRMMAYSSIAHMGYALAGLAAGTHEGAFGVMIYMTGYVFMGAGTFAIILLMRRDGQSATRIDDLRGLSNQPLFALGLMVMMFSMAGIPPLAGFSKCVCFWRRSMQGWCRWLLLA